MLLNPDIWLALLRGVPVTLALTIGGFAVGAVLGLPIMWARNSRIAPLRWVARCYIELLRGIPPIVWLFLIYNVPAQLNPLLAREFTPLRSGILGLGLICAAYMAEIYRGCLSAIKTGQWEASFALGMSRWDTASQVIGPQMFRIAIPAAATYAIGLLKDSSVRTRSATSTSWARPPRSSCRPTRWRRISPPRPCTSR